MITAEQIMSGKLPTTIRTFDVPGIGEISLHRLPVKNEIETKQLAQKPELTDKDSELLESTTLNNVYFMLHGRFDEKESKKLAELMDNEQLVLIHMTGLFFMNLKQSNLEELEKN